MIYYVREPEQWAGRLVNASVYCPEFYSPADPHYIKISSDGWSVWVTWSAWGSHDSRVSLSPYHEYAQDRHEASLHAKQNNKYIKTFSVSANKWVIIADSDLRLFSFLDLLIETRFGIVESPLQIFARVLINSYKKRSNKSETNSIQDFINNYKRTKCLATLWELSFASWARWPLSAISASAQSPTEIVISTSEVSHKDFR